MYIRTACASYRELVLRNYVYMRDAALHSFWNNKVSKKLAFLQTAALADALSDTRGPRTSTGGGAGAGSGATATRNHCTTCNRTHQGRPCAAAPLSAALRTKLGAGLRQRQYEKALRHCKEAFAANPSIAHEGLVEAARQAANS